MIFHMIDPRVNVYIMGNHHSQRANHLFLWPFFIFMLIYQRVTIQNDGLNNDGLNNRDWDLQGILSFADHLVKCQVWWYN